VNAATRVRIAMLATGKTRDELAHALGLATATLDVYLAPNSGRDIERARRRARLDLVAEVLGVSVETLHPGGDCPCCGLGRLSA